MKNSNPDKSRGKTMDRPAQGDSRRERTRRRLRAAKGKINTTGGRPEKEETRRAIARAILHFRRLSGDPSKRASYKKIAAHLNAGGVLTKEGNKWSAQDVYDVVSTEREKSIGRKKTRLMPPR